MASVQISDGIQVATRQELRDAGVKVVRGTDHNIAVFFSDGEIFAVDNRCPHMGFPLDRGTVKDGMLTCHWHQARFDLRSGCTFDLWADDVLRFDTWEKGKIVYVSPLPTSRLTEEHHRKRLIQGMEQNVGLVQAKSLLALMESGSDLTTIIADVVSYAANNLNSLSEGMIRLTCVGNLLPYLADDTAYQALYYAIRRLAEETSAAVPHRPKEPLAGDSHRMQTLKSWLLQWVRTRHRDGAERTLLTGLAIGGEQDLADLVFSAASERMYANGGHLFEDCNKVFELRSILGVSFGKNLFPLLVERLTQSRGEEESTNWNHPVQIVDQLLALDKELEAIITDDMSGEVPSELLDTLLGDDPAAIVDALKRAFCDKVSPRLLAREVSYAAGLRLAQFAISNEVTDWFNPQHTFIYTNGVYQAVSRAATPTVVRAIVQGAISVYMDRFLNVPAARLPRNKDLSGLSDEPAVLLTALLAELDQRSNVDDAADIVARYIQLGNPMAELIDKLTEATVREDLDFHSLQVLDAAVNQWRAWTSGPQIEDLFVGVTRNLAAHCPTRRAGQQTARIAAKLQRGEKIYQG